MEDIAWEEVFQAEFLALEWIQVLQDQNTILDRARQATYNDCWILDTLLGLAVSFMPTAAWPPFLALLAPWQLHTAP